MTSPRRLLRQRLRDPRTLLRQLVVGEALTERPRRGLVVRRAPERSAPPASDAAPAAEPSAHSSPDPSAER